MDNPNSSTVPPQPYNTIEGSTYAPPNPNQPDVPHEAPPKYEAPKEGPYAENTGYPQQGYPQQGYPPQGNPPQGYPPQGNPPQGYPPPGNPPQGYPQSVPGYPPQPFNAQPQPAYGATVNQTIIIRDAGFNSNPRTLECPNCHSLITTQATYTSGGITWLASGLICLFGCWFGCCLIPFCVPELQDVEHHCPSCHRHVGTYHRL